MESIGGFYSSIPDFGTRVRLGFSVAMDVSGFEPCGTFGRSIEIDEEYKDLANTFTPQTFPNPWHIGVLNKETYPNPEELIQGEFELLAFLYSFVLSTKPRIIVETGTNIGLTTRALAIACAVNGFGHVFTGELDSRFYEHARNLLTKYSLTPYVTQYLGKAEHMAELHTADFVFIDSSYESREIELTLLKSGAIFVYHDTWAERHLLSGELSKPRYERVTIPGPRGYTIGKVLID